ncbi:hypothetical protein F0265_11485 [Vibrio sp. RE88]|nr:hypothetical protein [Vibrio sp. RE88]
MKWHGLYLTVAAFWLITLPIKSFGEHCREDTWNQALKSQAEVEHWYNKKALSFNQLLEAHRQQVFLHQEFSEQEIASFWQPGKQALHDKMNRQIEAANIVIQTLNQEINTLNSESAIIDNAIMMWESIHHHCKIAGHKLNSSSSLTYIQLNQALMHDSNTLLRKVDLIRSIYQQEIVTLADAKEHSRH